MCAGILRSLRFPIPDHLNFLGAYSLAGVGKFNLVFLGLIGVVRSPLLLKSLVLRNFLRVTEAPPREDQLVKIPSSWGPWGSGVWGFRVSGLGLGFRV